MSAVNVFYICPTCFNACETAEECHEHQMMGCDPGELGHERRKPVMDAAGRVYTRAPRWYLEAVGWIQADYASGAA
jgi:hypothetical protein